MPIGINPVYNHWLVSVFWENIEPATWSLLSSLYCGGSTGAQQQTFATGPQTDESIHVLKS